MLPATQWFFNKWELVDRQTYRQTDISYAEELEKMSSEHPHGREKTHKEQRKERREVRLGK